MSDVAVSDLRDLLRRWSTGVAVVTTLDRDGAPVGKIANSFASVSLNPPLVLWCVDRASTQYDSWVSAAGYVVHVLGSGQQRLVSVFSRRGGDKFSTVSWRPGYAGMPLLDGASARFECRMWTTVDAGDHTVLLGRVVEVASADSPPLLVKQGQIACVEDI
ncbi:MAG: flavin reductase family protein [Nocardioidaceae bacterium]